jgi:tetratricopeptide (TPR) repeat protein
MKNLIILLFTLTTSVVLGQLTNGGIILEYELSQGAVPETGIQYYSNILEEHPQNTKALIKRSELYRALGRNAEADADRNLAQLINPYSNLFLSQDNRNKIFPKRSYGYAEMDEGETKLFSKNYLLEDEYERVLDSDHITEESKMMMESTIKFINMGDHRAAYQLLEKINDLDKSTALCYDLLGVIALEEKEYDEAIKMFTYAIEIDNGFTIAYHNRAVAHKLKGDFEAAERDFLTALSQRADIAKIKFSKAKMFELKGDKEGARNFYEDAINSSSDEYLEARLNYSTMLKAAGEYTKAMIEINKLIEDHPNEYKNYYVRGGLYFIYGEYSNAVKDFDVYLANHEDDHDVLFYRGLSQVLKGETVRGCEDINESIEKGYSKHADLYLYMCNQ